MRWKPTVLMLVVFLCQCLGVTVTTAAPSSPQAQLVEPYLQNLTQTGVTILWNMDNTNYGWVEYGTTEELGNKKDAVIDGLRSVATDHRIRLTDLEPGTVYHYRVCTKPIESFAAYEVVFKEPVYSAVYSFKTPSGKDASVTCVIFNDLHNNYDTFNTLIKQLDGVDYQLSIFNGDCFTDPAKKAGVVSALAKYNRGVKAHSIPPIYVRGNHESRGAFARGMKPLFDYPDNRYYFAMTAGPARLIFLDGGEDKPDSHPVYAGLNDFREYRKAQAAWLRDEIQSAPFKLAMYRILIHHIPRPLEEPEQRASSVRIAIPGQEQFDMAICGHTHRPAFIPAQTGGSPYPVMIGGAPSNGTVIVLSADAKRLKVAMLNGDGKLLAEHEQTARAGSSGDARLSD